MQQFGLVVCGPAEDLRTEMRLGIDRHDEVWELHPGVCLVQFAADILQLRRRPLRREPPDLDLGAIEPELPALNGLADAFESVLDLLAQLSQHRLDGVFAACRCGRRAPRIQHRCARLERQTRGDVDRTAAQRLT